MMRKFPIFLAVGSISMLSASLAVAIETSVYYVDGPQDPLWVPQIVHEVGDLPPVGQFPPGEQIRTNYWQYTDQTACFDGSDNPLIPNVLVSITRIDVLNESESYRVWYVADPQTTISNFDGWIGNRGLHDAEEAFRIDWSGINRPLVSEDKIQNGLLDPNETWVFIIQDFVNALGGSPAPFDSIGIASLSSGWPPSTGSLIVPEPATVGLLIFGGLAMVLGRRSRA